MAEPPSPSPRSCPLCSASQIEELLSIDDAPLQIGVAWDDRRTASAALCGQIRLSMCARCGFAFNSAFASGGDKFSPGYDVSLHHSETYRGYLREEAMRLIERHGIQEKTVLEVGCGTGYFLELLCRLGSNDGLGFDPALPTRRDLDLPSTSVRMLAEPLDVAKVVAPVDAIVCRSVLELVPEPLTLLGQMRCCCRSADEQLLYLEVPNARWIFGAANPWNVHFEHCCYFTVDTLIAAVERNRFAVSSCEPCYIDGQYLRLEAVTTRRPQPQPVAEPADDLAGLRDFAESYRAEVERWQRRLRDLRRAGKRVAVWGAGGRGATFLNTVCARLPDDLDLIAYAIDVNPDRQGKYVPRTGHPIVSPDRLHDDPADVILVTNPTYETEIRAATRASGIRVPLIAI